MSRPPSLRSATWSCALLALCACGGGPVEFGPERRFERAQRPTEFGAPDGLRLGLREMRPALEPTGYAAPTPTGWTARPARQFRNLDFQVAGEPDAECYLTVGIGGSVPDNAARWFEQFGAAVAPLPEPAHTLLGLPAALVEVEGVFQGKPGFALLGLIAAAPEGRVHTLKMTGPREVVGRERDAFLELSRAIRALGPGDDSAGRQAGAPDQPGPGAQVAGPGNGGGDGSVHAGTVPSGWREIGAGGFRNLDFRIGSASECYVTVLGGDGGGVRANLDRWRGEMGLGALSDAEYAALARLPALGVEATLLELRGGFRNVMTGKEIADAMLLGAVALRPEGAVFVKMIGPVAEVEPERQAFAAFCSGLRW
jgi:hypothetical protein